jgi:MFS family permease
MRGLRADTVYLLLEGVMSFAFGLVFTVTGVYFVTVVGMNPLQLVLVGTALELTAFLFEIPTGTVADTYSRRLSVIIGIFVLGAAFVLRGLAPVFEFMLPDRQFWASATHSSAGPPKRGSPMRLARSAPGGCTYKRRRSGRLPGSSASAQVSRWQAFNLRYRLCSEVCCLSHWACC